MNYFSSLEKEETMSTKRINPDGSKIWIRDNAYFRKHWMPTKSIVIRSNNQSFYWKDNFSIVSFLPEKICNATEYYPLHIMKIIVVERKMLGYNLKEFKILGLESDG